MDESGRPTILKAGIPDVISLSTSTNLPSRPIRDVVLVFEYIFPPFLIIIIT